MAEDYESKTLDSENTIGNYVKTMDTTAWIIWGTIILIAIYALVNYIQPTQNQWILITATSAIITYILIHKDYMNRLITIPEAEIYLDRDLKRKQQRNIAPLTQGQRFTILLASQTPIIDGKENFFHIGVVIGATDYWQAIVDRRNPKNITYKNMPEGVTGRENPDVRFSLGRSAYRDKQLNDQLGGRQ